VNLIRTISQTAPLLRDLIFVATMRCVGLIVPTLRKIAIWVSSVRELAQRNGAPCLGGGANGFRSYDAA